jgi:serine/threonine-protein kinase
MPINLNKAAGHVEGKAGQFGPYQLHELIARGGMAEIWLATNAEGQSFALRIMTRNSLLAFAARKQFTRGCEILRQIHDHSHVIGYVEHGKIDGTLYLLMEYVEASNLRQLIGRRDPILGELIGNILIDMAVAIEHVHTSGFIHLDFKPENILITRNGDLRLVDFDLAEPKGDKPRKMTKHSGTPAYMSPEQLRNDPLDHRADIFSCGATAYELLTFRPAFDGNTPQEVLRKQLDAEHPITPPREHNPDVPIAVEKIILKCLERDPDKRYPFTSVLVRDLQAALYVK